MKTVLTFVFALIAHTICEDMGQWLSSAIEILAYEYNKLQRPLIQKVVIALNCNIWCNCIQV